MTTTPGPTPSPNDCTTCATPFADCDAQWQRIREVCCDDCRDTVTCSHDGIVARRIEQHLAVMS